jgi:hypothetical protein
MQRRCEGVSEGIQGRIARASKQPAPSVPCSRQLHQGRASFGALGRDVRPFLLLPTLAHFHPSALPSLSPIRRNGLSPSFLANRVTAMDAAPGKPWWRKPTTPFKSCKRVSTLEALSHCPSPPAKRLNTTAAAPTIPAALELGSDRVQQ